MEIDYNLLCSSGFSYDNSILTIKEHVFMKTRFFGSNRFDSVKLVWK